MDSVTGRLYPVFSATSYKIGGQQVNTFVKTFLQWLAEMGATSGAFGVSDGSPLGITKIVERPRPTKKNRFGDVKRFGKTVIDMSGSKNGITGTVQDDGNGL